MQEQVLERALEKHEGETQRVVDAEREGEREDCELSSCLRLSKLPCSDHSVRLIRQIQRANERDTERKRK